MAYVDNRLCRSRFVRVTVALLLGIQWALCPVAEAVVQAAAAGDVVRVAAPDSGPPGTHVLLEDGPGDLPVGVLVSVRMAGMDFEDNVPTGADGGFSITVTVPDIASGSYNIEVYTTSLSVEFPFTVTGAAPTQTAIASATTTATASATTTAIASATATAITPFTGLLHRHLRRPPTQRRRRRSRGLRRCLLPGRLHLLPVQARREAPAFPSTRRRAHFPALPRQSWTSPIPVACSCPW